MEFIEASAFTRMVSEYWGDEEYRKLQHLLVQNPTLGDVMPGTGGFRKLRWADQRRGKGRRGGVRVIYYHFLTDHQIWFITIYAKNEVSDLSASEKKSLKSAVGAELKVRQARAPATKKGGTQR